MIAIVDLQWCLVGFINLEERDAKKKDTKLIMEKTSHIQREVQQIAFFSPAGERLRRNMLGLYKNTGV